MVKAQKRQLGLDVLKFEQQMLTELRSEGTSAQAVSAQLRLLTRQGAGLLSKGERRQDELRDALASIQEQEDGRRRDQGKAPRPASGLVAVRGLGEEMVAALLVDFLFSTILVTNAPTPVRPRRLFLAKLALSPRTRPVQREAGPPRPRRFGAGGHRRLRDSEL